MFKNASIKQNNLFILLTSTAISRSAMVEAISN